MRRVTTPRRGFTLAESLVGIVIAAIVSVIVISLALRQGAAGAYTLLHAASRAQLAHGRGALAGDLATVSHGVARLITASDSLIEIDAQVGMSLSCSAALPLARTIVIAAAGQSGRPPVDGWLRAMALGDSVAVFDPVAGVWDVTALSGWGTASCGSLPGSPPGRALHLGAPGLTRGLPAGTLVRVGRRVRWLTYLGSDGRWYLGARERTGGAWSIVQPTAGPLDQSRGRPRPFALFDAAGQPGSNALPASAVSRVEVNLALLGDAASDRIPLVAPVRRRP